MNIYSHMNATLDSFSAAESNMEELSNPTINTNQHTNKEDEVDDEVWATFNNSFRQVQSVLERNRVLIQQVNENHQSRIPGNMVKNVSLIQELNGNISKVVGLYSDLNSNFSTAYHQRNLNSKNNCKKAWNGFLVIFYLSNVCNLGGSGFYWG